MRNHRLRFLSVLLSCVLAQLAIGQCAMAQGAVAHGGMAQGGMAQGGMAQGGMAQGGMAQGGMAHDAIANNPMGHDVMAHDVMAPGVMAPSGHMMRYENEPGLLGRHFLEAQFIMLRPPEEIRSFDSSMTGMTMTLNVPTPWNPMLPEAIGQDLFVSGLGLNYGGTGAFGGALIDVNAQLRSVSAGVNTYLYLTNDIRPFVQLGVTYDASTAGLSGGGFSFEETDLESKLLVNPGIELDLTDQVALRGTLDLDTEEQFDDSMYRVELIAWPVDWLYVRGGVVGDVQGDTIGGLIGAGLAW